MRPTGFTITLFRSLLASILLASATVPAHARKADCPTPLGDRADSAEDRISTWNDLVDWYRRYAPCDDGETADGIYDKVATLFASRWRELMQAAPTFERDPALRRFLLRHIDVVGMSADQARHLATRARTRCTPSNIGLCRQIAEEADATVKEATR